MKKEGKGKNILIIILLIIVIALLSIIVLSKLGISNINLSSNKNSNVKTTAENITKNAEKNVEIIKENLIYTKNYFDNEICYENSTYNTKICSSRIVLPYINVESEDAEKINNTISNIANDNYKILNQAISNNEELNELKTNYNYYIYNNLLSIVITETIGHTDLPVDKSYIYLLDLNTLSIVDNDNIYSYIANGVHNNISINKQSAQEYAKEAIFNTMQQFPMLSSVSGEKLQTLAGECYSEFVKDQKLFVDNSGDLYIIAKLNKGAGLDSCSYETTINLTRSANNN